MRNIPLTMCSGSTVENKKEMLSYFICFLLKCANLERVNHQMMLMEIHLHRVYVPERSLG